MSIKGTRLANFEMKIPIRSPNGKTWSMADATSYKDEAHLQAIIYDNPDVIPFEDMNPESAKLKKLPIRELGLPGSGNTDIVVVDQSGAIYVIETKLARNPEAKRKVVGQILEYAAYLWEKDFDWLDSRVKNKLGKSLAEHFQEDPSWVKENFEENLTNNLKEGSFQLMIVVDQLNPELQRTAQFMKNRLSVNIYPIEVRYFKDKDGTEVLLPRVLVSASVAEKAPAKPLRSWDERSFFEDASGKVDTETLGTLRKLYEFGQELGEIVWGQGATHGTFQVRIPFGGQSVSMLVVSSTGKRNWFGFKKLTELGAERSALVDYIVHLKSLGVTFDEDKDWNRYPEFDVSVLNSDDVFASFKERTLKAKKVIAQS